MNVPKLPRPSATMAVAMTALVSSLAGPAVADEVAQIAQSITSSSQIKNGSVTGADVKNESLSSTDLLDGSVRSSDLGTGQVQTSDLAADSVRGDKIPTNAIDASDIKDEALSGREINEALLGTVPSAAKAGSADAVGGQRLLSLQGKANKGQTITLAQTKDFVFSGLCRDQGASGTQAIIEVKSLTDNNYISMNDTDEDFDAFDQAEAVENTSTTEDGDSTQEPNIYAASNDFIVWDGDGQDWSVVVNTNGADCRFNSSPFFVPAG